MSDKDESVSAFVVTDDGLPLASGYTDMTVVSRRRYTQLVKAKHSGRWWMLKGLLPACRDQMIYQNLLQKEYKLMAPLQHPNVVNTLNWEQIDGLGCCIVMEWIDGVNLQQWLAGRHPQKDRRRVASQVMDAIQYIHGLQLAHRDIKPANIMITRHGGNVKLIDFGLSDADSYAVFKQQAGTDGYMDPALSSGINVSAKTADIYSLGCVLSDLRLGAGFRHIVRKCCAPPSHRFQHIEDVQTAFRRAEWLPRLLLTAALAFGVLLAVVFTVMRSNDYKMNLVLEKTQNDSQRLASTIRQSRLYNAARMNSMIVLQAQTALRSKLIQDSLQARIDELEAEASRTEGAQRQMSEYTHKGRLVVDRLSRSTDRLMHSVSTGKETLTAGSLTKVSGQMMDTWEKILPAIQGFVHEKTVLNDEARLRLETTLQKYAYDKYQRPWLSILNEAREKAGQ